ncbi:MAG: SH3 domain-containing protein [Desulfomonile tiedjei]|nr:SH3 domain-containing protein [Desulfomonile tiedjei]
MHSGENKKPISQIVFFIVLGAVCWSLTACQEVDTLKREVWNKLQSKLKPKSQFAPRDGITITACSLHQTANDYSEVIRKIPAETSVHLIDKVGEWYRVRMRDGREGYLKLKVIGGEDIILLTTELRRSIEGMPVQAEGMTKTKANFRLQAGREYEVIEVLPPDRKLEVYERVVTVRRSNPGGGATRGRPAGQAGAAEEPPAHTDLGSDDVKKDVWYKVKIEDGRVGYIYTHNLRLTPPDDIARVVPFMRMVAWRTVNTTDDQDRGAMNNYIVAYAPIGKDPGCDYTRLYFMNWSKRRVISWQLRLNGVLPIGAYQFEGKPGFSVRYLHPSKPDRLVLASFVVSSGRVRKVGEEEIPNNREIR